MIDSAVFAEISQSIKHLTDEEIRNRIRMIDNNMRQYRLEATKIKQDMNKVQQELKENHQKIKQNKQLPWLVSNIVEILDMPTELNDDGTIDAEEKPEDKCIVVKTSTRNTVFLPVPGLVDVLNILFVSLQP